MRYEDVLSITREEAETAFSSENPQKICDALIRSTYHELDWRWALTHCLSFGKHPNPEIRTLAVTCIAHLARIHGVLDMQLVRPLLNELLKDPEVSSRVEDALDDFEIYLSQYDSIKKHK